MRPERIGVLLCALAIAADASAQTCFARNQDIRTDLSATAWQRLTKRTEVRQNTNVEKDIAQPAFVTFINPAEGPTTYQIGVGIMSGIWAGTGCDVDAIIDYQRNTATDDEQDSFKAGLTGYWRPLDLVGMGHSPSFSARSNYRNDGVKETRAWQNAIGYTHLFSGQQRFPMPNHIFPIGAASGQRTGVLDLVYFPYGGLEFDTVVGAPSEPDQGTAVRGVVQINAAFYPAPMKTGRPVEILVGYTYRKDFKDTGTNQADDGHPLFTFEANYFPINGKGMGFGVSYVNGEDPDEGFTHQAYWQFSLKFRLKRS